MHVTTANIHIIQMQFQYNAPEFMFNLAYFSNMSIRLGMGSWDATPMA